MQALSAELARDVAKVAQIDAVPTILNIVCRATSMGFAAIARVTEDRWIACAVRDDINFGLRPGGELNVGTTLCREVRQSGGPIVIDHVAQDPVFRGHPTPALHGFQSYLSMPIFRGNGEFFGTLCAIDPKPAQISAPYSVETFRLLANLVGLELDAIDKKWVNEASLLDEREAAVLREQFIAILGHDLRNPLASIRAGAALLRVAPAQAAPLVLDRIERSVGRMAELIDDLSDFARARLGGGIGIARHGDDSLAAALEHVVDELRASFPGRSIESRIDAIGSIDCDRGRIGQLASNLLANALTYGASDRPVSIAATTSQGQFELTVSNHGQAIDPATLKRLFQPFYRAAIQPSRQGLGLGLYIAAEIASAHGGAITVQSSGKKTTFRFQMPLTQVALTNEP